MAYDPGPYNGTSGIDRMRLGGVQSRAVRAGKMNRAVVCCACGQTEGRVVMHLEDYARWREPIPLCLLCHSLLHVRDRHKETRDRYREVIGNGARFGPAVPPGHWPWIGRFFLYRREPITSSSRGPKRQWRVLDLIEVGHFVPGTRCTPATCRCSPCGTVQNAVDEHTKADEYAYKVQPALL